MLGQRLIVQYVLNKDVCAADVIVVIVSFLWKDQGQDTVPALSPFCCAGLVALTPLAGLFALFFRGKQPDSSSFSQFPFQREQSKARPREPMCLARGHTAPERRMGEKA